LYVKLFITYYFLCLREDFVLEIRGDPEPCNALDCHARVQARNDNKSATRYVLHVMRCVLYMQRATMILELGTMFAGFAPRDF
jgi:hypothetical protein